MKEIASGIFLLKGAGLCSNIYLLEAESGAVAIDSGGGSVDLSALSAAKCFLTHGHHDHALGIKTLPPSSKALISKAEIQNLEKIISSPLPSDSPSFQGFKECSSLLPLLSPLPDTLSLPPFLISVVEAPGHSSGSVCFFEKKTKTLFSGDTLFANGVVGRTDLFSGSEEALQKSLSKISKLDYSLLCPGHGALEKRE